MSRFSRTTRLDKLIDWTTQVAFSGDDYDDYATFASNSLSTYFLAQESHVAWVREYFCTGDDIKLGLVSMNLWNPLQYGVQSTSVHISWAYDSACNISMTDEYGISGKFASIFT